MPLSDRTRILYAELATALGLADVAADKDGSVQLTIGADTSVVLFAQDDGTILVVSPVAALPEGVDYGTTLWLLRQNLYDSSLAPFCIACDDNGNIILWGRVPIDTMTGRSLADLVDAVAARAGQVAGNVRPGPATA